MSAKVKPTKKIKKFERYNCSGKLRVQVNVDGGEVSEVILLTKKGGCKYNLQLIGRLITFALELNADVNDILKVLDDNDPCPAVIRRMKDEGLPKEETGVGGCAKIIKQAIEEKLNETKDK